MYVESWLLVTELHSFMEISAHIYLSLIIGFYSLADLIRGEIPLYFDLGGKIQSEKIVVSASPFLATFEE